MGLINGCSHRPSVRPAEARRGEWTASREAFAVNGLVIDQRRAGGGGAAGWGGAGQAGCISTAKDVKRMLIKAHYGAIVMR